MALPVWRIDGGILNWIAAVDHLTVAGIDAHMGHRVAGIVGSSKENDVSGSGFRRADMLTLVIDSLRRGSRHVVISAVSEHIAHKARTIEAC